MDEKRLLREENNARNKMIADQWKEIYEKYPEALEDYFQYVLGLAATYRRWAEDQQMLDVPLDDHRVSQFLQNARTCDTVRTYITSRIDQDVAQPIKKSK